MGDYIDRGPDGKGVLDFLMTEPFNNFEHIFLRGNHEQMLIDSLSGKKNDIYFFLENGGKPTVKSFGLEPISLYFNINPWLDAINPYYNWFNQLHYFHRVDDWMFVHAGIDSRFPIDQQDSFTMMWIRDRFLNDDTDFGVKVVHGHSITRAGPEIKHNRINIDTGAFHTNCLTAICIENNKEPYFLAARISITENS